MLRSRTASRGERITTLPSIGKHPNHPDVSASNLALQARIRRSPAMTAGYRISAPGDTHEREAAQIADRLMRPCSDTSIRHATTPDAATRNSDIFRNDNGSLLPETTRTFFEQRFGCDLGHVRIHDNRASHLAAREMRARAYTHNNHIGFDQGQYQPDSLEGRRLLAHELAHVVQQTDANTIYCERWNIDDNAREVERELLVQLNFENTWTDWWNDTGWTTNRKNTFRSNFVSSIETTFNNSSFVLQPPTTAADVLPQESIEQGYKPLVEITLVPDGEWSTAEDWEVDVESNPTSEFRTSSSSTNYGYLDEADNAPVTKLGADPGVTQVPTVHEFGHFIGLDHPGEGLEGGIFSASRLSPGADAYSHTGTDAQGRTVHGPSDLMGSGMGLRPFYYDAWARALDDHIAVLRREQMWRDLQESMRRMFSEDVGDFPVPQSGTIRRA